MKDAELSTALTAAEATPAANARVLVVDDNADMCGPNLGHLLCSPSSSPGWDMLLAFSAVQDIRSLPFLDLLNFCSLSLVLILSSQVDQAADGQAALEFLRHNPLYIPGSFASLIIWFLAPPPFQRPCLATLLVILPSCRSHRLRRYDAKARRIWYASLLDWAQRMI